MSAPRWTPGPWLFEQSDGVVSFDAGNYQRALASLIPTGIPYQRSLNGRLIAAAPGLYDALERASTLLDAVVRLVKDNPCAAGCTVFFDEAECDVDCLAEDCEIAVRDARAALAQARGEA